MRQVNDPAANTTEGQLQAAIDVVEAVFGPDPHGETLDIVAAVLLAIRENRAAEAILEFD